MPLARYVDWIATTPIMLYEPCHPNPHPHPHPHPVALTVSLNPDPNTKLDADPNPILTLTITRYEICHIGGATFDTMMMACRSSSHSYVVITQQ